jgi:hypothetical protein
MIVEDANLSLVTWNLRLSTNINYIFIFSVCITIQTEKMNIYIIYVYFHETETEHRIELLSVSSVNTVCLHGLWYPWSITLPLAKSLTRSWVHACFGHRKYCTKMTMARMLFKCCFSMQTILKLYPLAANDREILNWRHFILEHFYIKMILLFSYQ